MTNHEVPYESEQHPHSRRWAVVEDDGEAAWLYLTARDSLKPVSACFLYNRSNDSTAPQTGIHFRWSGDGENVAVLFGTDLMGFITAGEPRGFSKLLKAPGTLGSPLDGSLYERIFRAT